jgi:hypothetical protein
MPIKDNEPITSPVHEKFKELEHQYRYHPPSGERVKQHERLRAEFLEVAKVVAYVVPAGREQALALTKLEEALFWANAGVARE